MNKNREETISLVEYQSPSRSIPQPKSRKRKNKISSPPIHSPAHHEKENDISTIFSVKKSNSSSQKIVEKSEILTTNSDLDNISTSELSDDVFENITKTGSKSYKDKIRERFKSVKNQASTSANKARFGVNLRDKITRIRRESDNIDAEIQSVRNKYDLKPSEQKQIDFFLKENHTKNDDKIDNVSSDEDNNKIEITFYSVPDHLEFTSKLSENESFFYPNKSPLNVTDKLSDENPRNLEEEGYYVNEIKGIPKGQLNLIEKRLLGVDDRKWFGCNGDLNILNNPLTSTSLRPPLPPPNENIISYLPATTKDECNEIIIIHENILELNISNLKFLHHPLFSTEHVLARKLLSHYEKYKNSTENNNIQRLTNQLNALRHVKKNVENLQKQSGDADRNKIHKYDKEIKLLRTTLLNEAKQEREHLKAIFSIWKSIKKIRTTTNYSNTRLKLLIKKEKVDFLQDQNKYDRDFNEMLHEIILEFKSEYKEKVKIYKKELEAYKLKTEEVLEEAPEKPVYNVDEEKIKLQLQKQFLESFRSPGEPVIKLLLSDSNEITSEVTDTKEIDRRCAVDSTKMYLKIICNKLEVCKSKIFSLNNEFLCDINETYSILLTNIPKYLAIELIEVNKLIRKKISEINIFLPSRSVKSNSKSEIFEKLEDVSCKHTGVGSGISLKTILEPFEIYNIEDSHLSTLGCLQYCVGWENFQSSDSCIISNNFICDIIKKNGSIDEYRLKEWMSQSIPDPQDPKNSILFEYTSDYKEYLPNIYKKKKDYFRLDPYLDSLKFCELSEIEDNLRLTVLHLRNQNEIEFDGMFVPNRIKEIPFHILSDYKKRILLETGSFQLEENDDNDLDRQRYISQKHLKQIHIKVFQKCKNMQHNLTYEDVVDEKYLAFFQEMIRVLLKNFVNWFRWEPKISQSLPTMHKTSNQVMMSMENTKQVKISFNIISAKNIPKRREEPKEVCPFVEVSYESISLRSTTKDGINPIWNETLVVPLESQHTDYLNPNSLNGTIVIRLFDESKEKNTANLLGSLEISISAICCSVNMTGLFKIRLPNLLLGYETELEKINTNTPRSNLQQLATHSTYLEMKISSQPNISKLTASMDELPCNEIPRLKDHIVKWNESYNNSYPNRKFSALAIDGKGRTTCILRYINPLEPPQINAEEFDITADQCARYVSLIPFTECNQFYQKVWLTTEQFLNLMIGSVIDHAVALTCYLLSLKMNVWLLLGYGIPHGSTAYVLVEDSTVENVLPVYYVYDVVQNEKFNLLDGNCPLQRIYCIVNKDNIWANTQRTDTPSLLRFDLTRRSDWLPLFDRHFSAPTNSINTEISYKPKITVDVLEAQLERKIKKKINKLRQLDRTIWNQKISNLFKSSLRMFEINTMYNKNNNDLILELQKSLINYRVNGFIVNMSYSNVNTIIKKIIASGIHLQNFGNSEFAIATYIHVYGGELLSVWIFIANVNLE